MISIHALLAESDHDWPPVRDIIQWISIHALLAESDVVHALKLADTMLFLSTLSLRRATGSVSGITSSKAISIHALLAESDMPSMGAILISKAFLSTLSLRRATLHCNTPNIFRHYFYPRSPCGERLVNNVVNVVNKVFLSTLSLRRATRIKKQHCNNLPNFYPRSPCGERQAPDISDKREARISIHALLAESDDTRSTVCSVISISIHALLAESDSAV